MYSKLIVQRTLYPPRRIVRNFFKKVITDNEMGYCDKASAGGKNEKASEARNKNGYGQGMGVRSLEDLIEVSGEYIHNQNNCWYLLAV